MNNTDYYVSHTHTHTHTLSLSLSVMMDKNVNTISRVLTIDAIFYVKAFAICTDVHLYQVYVISY